ncbi:MAG: glycogen debranching N-terminal domain-containing protein [Actinomycetota bacterium]
MEAEPDHLGVDESSRTDQAAVPILVTDLANKVLAVKEGETFLYSDTEGNLDDRKDFGLGLYHRDTRFLSHFMMRLSGREPVLLSSSSERAYMAHVDLTNPDLYEGDHLSVPQQTLNIRRIRAINGRLYERVRVKNYNPYPVSVDVSFSFGADFADIFEVRGMAREQPGHYEAPTAEGRRAQFGYLGRDDVHRVTRIEFSTDPASLEVVGDLVRASFRLRLGAYQTRLVAMTIEAEVGDEAAPEKEFDAAVHELRRSYEEWERESMHVVTDNELFNTLLARGLRDLRALYTRWNGEAVLAAGIPWYVATFGRDALITSHQLLSITPEPARSALEFLAERQGTKVDEWRDEEPGKILHEIRRGELAGAHVVPHTPYFGSVDSTPLFLLLYAQHFRWTGDLELARRLLPNVRAALEWIDRYGDADGDGFVEYRTRSPNGIRNQGWKDSHDSVVHADGRMAEPPIALAEVQAYVYLAKLRVGEVFEALGDHDQAEVLRTEAEVLRRRFNDAFWMDDEQFFAGALDADKRQVRTIVSNPGHALYCDIVDADKAEHVARRLLAPDMFSGWGIRTMSKSAAAYNPMSYHNGSVWPHDNAFIAAGLKRYGFVKETNRVATAMFDAAIHADYMRLPELFCGFTRRSPNRPVSYPVACSPQAWAAGSPFLTLQAMLGISARAHENVLTVNKPHLPPWLNTVELRGLRVGESKISLVFRREGDITGFSLISREGDVRVIMEE